MLKPGQLIGTLLEPGSMAAAIEQAMVAQDLLDLDEETEEAAEQRRKAFIAISTGVINHIKGHIEIVVAANKFDGTTPSSQTLLLGSAGEVK